MDFSDALRELKNGKAVTRRVWNDGNVTAWQGTELRLVRFGGHQGIPVAPLLMIRRTENPKPEWIPFAGATWDILAEDWEIAG